MVNNLTPCRSATHTCLIAIGSVMFLGIAISSGCHSRGPEVGGANNSKARDARKHAESYALAAAKGAAEAEVKINPRQGSKFPSFGKFITIASGKTTDADHDSARVTPSQPEKPMPPIVISMTAQQTPEKKPINRGEVVIREKVVSAIPYRTDKEAEEDVLIQSQQRIEQKLRELDPPVEYKPSISVVKNEFIDKSTRVVRAPSPSEKALLIESGYDPERQYVEYTIEITADQVRHLRAQERVVSALRLVGVVSVFALGGFLFLRLDEWTKGYLTSWLAFIVIALGAGIASAVAFV